MGSWWKPFSCPSLSHVLSHWRMTNQESCYREWQMDITVCTFKKRPIEQRLPKLDSGTFYDTPPNQPILPAENRKGLGPVVPGTSENWEYPHCQEIQSQVSFKPFSLRWDPLSSLFDAKMKCLGQSFDLNVLKYTFYWLSNMVISPNLTCKPVKYTLHVF